MILSYKLVADFFSKDFFSLQLLSSPPECFQGLGNLIKRYGFSSKSVF